MKPTLVKIHTENDAFQYLETLRRNRTKRNQAQEFFVEGVRAITQAVQRRWQINALAYSRGKRLSDWAEGILKRAQAKIHYELTQPLMEKISQREAASELIAIVGMPADDLQRIPIHEALLVVVLDRPSNPGNLGAVIRSCDALRVDGIIMTGHAVDLYDPETIRATTGSFFDVPVVRLDSPKELAPWLEACKAQLGQFQVVGTSAKAEALVQDHAFNRPTALLMGNETVGLSAGCRALCEALVKIPMYGAATSLNLACATSILLYEIARQRG